MNIHVYSHAHLQTVEDTFLWWQPVCKSLAFSVFECVCAFVFALTDCLALYGKTWIYLWFLFCDVKASKLAARKKQQGRSSRRQANWQQGRSSNLHALECACIHITVSVYNFCSSYVYALTSCADGEPSMQQKAISLQLIWIHIKSAAYKAARLCQCVMPCHTRSLIRRDFCVQVSATDINMLFCIHTLHACAHRDAAFVGTTHSTIIFSFTKQTLAFTSWNLQALRASWFQNDSSALQRILIYTRFLCRWNAAAGQWACSGAW